MKVMICYPCFPDDTCVTRTEYVSVIPGMSNAISDPMFTHFDHDKDGCLNLGDMQAEYHLIDHSRKLLSSKC